MTIKNYRWLVVVLIFTATIINYIDRQIIGLLKPFLEKEFNWTETDFARIVMAFTAAYAVGLLFFGWLIDRIGTRIGYSLTVIFWSAASMVHALARSVFGFAMARVALGIGEAGNFPAGIKTVAEWFPKKEKALAIGIFNGGPSVGVVVALLMVPPILVHYGWQEVFWITGALGFVWLIFWLWLYEVPARQKRLSQEEYEYIVSDQEEEETDKNPVTWVRLFSFPQTWAYITGKGLIDPIFWFFLFWLPSYFASSYNLDLKKPSLELVIIYSATTIGSISGGWFSSQLIKRGWAVLRARKAVLLGFAFLELAVLLIPYASGLWSVVWLISFAVAIHQAWATNIFTLPSDLFPKQAVSSVVGIGGMAGAIGGILFPLMVGFILDSYKAGGNLNGGYNLIFTICGFTYLLAWLIIHFLTRNACKLTLGELK
ncbi:MFS transporter [Dyadobacter jiangsuensis]